MRRVLLAGVALSAALGIVAAAPARADLTARDATGVASSAGVVAALVNPILGAIPAPAGWHQRSICVGNEQIDKAWCLYFPWPV